MYRCQNCGKFTAKTVNAHFNKNIGMLFAREEQTFNGWVCPSCLRFLFCEYLATNLFLGWWGAISMLTNPLRIVFNIVSYIVAEAKLSKQKVLSGVATERLNGNATQSKLWGEDRND